MTRWSFSAPRPHVPRLCHTTNTFAWLAFALVLATSGAPAARAGGPRFVGGEAHSNRGQPLVWNTANLQYYTDPGDLSAGVPHAQADAMVAAASAVWNVPTSSIALSQGGQLAEHVSSANSYLGGTSVVFPADVQLANEGNIPVAIIYDTDGSVTDLLLGSGASNPTSCRQNAVVGDVDDLGANNAYDAIHHATLVLNGRCVGSAPEQLTQMQYQLARAFGRILGLSWSQTNDNVFTVKTPVSSQQLAFWPLMHPIDVICGTYTYQCMTNPFTLRIDDLSTLSLLYPVPGGNVPAGKQASDADAIFIAGRMSFPDGQGMEWVNYTTHRFNSGVLEDWQTTSAITGEFNQQSLPNPVTQTPPVPMGTTAGDQEGAFLLRRVPMNGVSNLFMDGEAINPLYIGEFSLGMYARSPATPSGTPPEMVGWSAYSYGDWAIPFYTTASDAAATCAPGADGTETAPAALDPSGWQTGLLCGWGHFSWWGLSIAAGHSWTFEVTATDETGAATLNKAEPVLGVWKATDATGILPTVASVPVPFNSLAFGVTQLRMSAASAARSLRLTVSDLYSTGRPDFPYIARLLYAANVSPVALGSSGGSLTITGMGFRQGNAVTVNGIAATVVSLTATQIVAIAPPMASAGALLGQAVAVAVTDATTGGSTRINGALTYTNTADLLQKVSAPSAVVTGIPAATPFAVRVFAADGVTPVSGATVRFAASVGSATFSLCSNSSSASGCTGTSDSTGLVQTAVTATSSGSLTLTATEVSGGATVQVTLNDTDPPRLVTIPNPTQWAPAGTAATWTVTLSALQNGAPASAAAVTWTATAGLTLSSSSGLTGSNGNASVSVSSSTLLPGSVSTVTGCVWTTFCATWTVFAVDPSQWQITVKAGAGQSVVPGESFAPLTLLITDLAGHPLAGAPATIHQRVLASEGACAAGSCPAAPVLATSSIAAIAASDGTVSVKPLQVSGQPQTVEIAISTGTVGFVTLTLVVRP